MTISKVLSLLITVAFFSCGGDSSENEEPVKQPNIHTLIFIDKTESVDITKPFVANKYQTALKQIIEDNINQAGDKVEVYYIHENTSKARTMSMTARSSMGDTYGMNITDIEATETSFNLSLRKERGIFTQQAIRRLMTANNGSSNLETNVTASIPVISKAAETATDVRVYYFSDMVESLKNGRDFHVNAPKSSEQATEWANTDAEKLQNYVIGNPMITMILPFEATSSSKENNPNVTTYWQTLFENLGVGNVQEI
ncbi:MAG: hypothetical protein QMB24_06935 [Spirosomataceae bacterium]|jgi:hypothetical protein